MNIRWSSLGFLVFGSIVVAGVPIGGIDPSREDEAEHWRKFNERCASDSLKTLTAAEADFRANDRDWCHVNDFWTSDVKGLYTMPSTPVATRDVETVRCVPIQYWDGIGTWHSNLWMLYRMCSGARVDAIKLIELPTQAPEE